MIDPSGRLRAARVVAQTAYRSFLVMGILTALSIFNTNLTTQMVEGFVFLLPKLLLSGRSWWRARGGAVPGPQHAGLGRQ
jgi:hypothetical protein